MKKEARKKAVEPVYFYGIIIVYSVFYTTETAYADCDNPVILGRFVLEWPTHNLRVTVLP